LIISHKSDFLSDWFLNHSFSFFAHPKRIAREGQRLQLICKEDGIKEAQWGGRGAQARQRKPRRWTRSTRCWRQSEVVWINPYSPEIEPMPAAFMEYA